MEQNVLVTKMIGIVVAIIVACAVLVPICNELTDGGNGEQITVQNNGTYRYSSLDGTFHIYDISLSGDVVVVSEGEVVRMSVDTATLGESDFVPILIGANSMMYITQNSAKPYYDGLVTSWGENFPFYDETTYEGDIVLTINPNGTLEGFGDEKVIEYLLDSEGDYVLTTSPNVLSDMGFFALSNPISGDSKLSIKSSLDTLSVDKITTMELDEDILFTQVVPTYEESDSAISLQNIVVTETYNPNTEWEEVLDVTASYFVVLLEYTSGGSSSNGDSVTSTLLGVIPIFVVLAILMGAVTLFYNRNGQ